MERHAWNRRMVERAGATTFSRACGFVALVAALSACCVISAQERSDDPEMAAVGELTLNKQADGYRGIWYMNQPSDDEYKYKYSGGLGTYCDMHNPFAVYCPEVNKTFFCYGGAPETNSRRLHHMVSYFDHETGAVPRPTWLLDKRTGDAHDNPVISVDDGGYIWVFSTSHGRSRPSYVHRSKRPYDIEEFERVAAVYKESDREVPLDNFSYMQAWHVPKQGFVCFFTKYNYPAARTSCFMTSPDGVRWSEWTRLAAIDEGHYQISAVAPGKVATAMNYHPRGKGLNWRTNLYYLESTDGGDSWHGADETTLELPLTTPDNPALVHDYAIEKLNVYIKDIQFDPQGQPIILYITSKGYQSGPANDPRTWTIAHWQADRWDFRLITTSDSNYDMGSLYQAADGTWRLIAPTESGPQPYNPGGEMALWTSDDQGRNWRKEKQLTAGSAKNHTYARRPVNAHPEFYAFWADGNARAPSDSSLYFCDQQGNVYRLPTKMAGDAAKPELVRPGVAAEPAAAVGD